MKNTNPIQQTYNDVKALGLVSNQCEFSILCGRTATWFSAIKARKLPLTTNATLTLSSNIRRRASEIDDAVVSKQAVSLSRRLIRQAKAQIEENL